MSNNPMYRALHETDPQIAAAIDNETRRQHEGLELIASENFVSEAVLEAAGSVFTNKYAEGYPCSPTQVRRQTWRPTRRFSSRATPSLVSTWLTAAISPMDTI